MRHLITLFVLGFSAQIPVQAQEVQSLRLGLPAGKEIYLNQTIHHVVYQLGPPDHTQLTGETDGAYDPKPTDSLVLSWNDRDCQFGAGVCTYWATFPSGSARLTRMAIHLNSSGRPSVESIREQLAGDAREVRYRLLPDEGEIEASISECTVPDGEVGALVLPEVGLDVFLEHSSRRVELLSYSIDREKEGWPRECED